MQKSALVRTFTLLLTLTLTAGLLEGCSQTAVTDGMTASIGETTTAAEISSSGALSGTGLAEDYLVRTAALPAPESNSTALGFLMLQVLSTDDFAPLTDEAFIGALQETAQNGGEIQRLYALLMLTELDFESSLTEHRSRYCDNHEFWTLREERLDAAYPNSGALADAYLASVNPADETFWQFVCQLTPIRDTSLNSGSSSMDATVYSDILNPYSLLMTALAATDYNRFIEESARCTAVLPDETKESGDPYYWCWEVDSGMPPLDNMRRFLTEVSESMLARGTGLSLIESLTQMVRSGAMVPDEYTVFPELQDALMSDEYAALDNKLAFVREAAELLSPAIRETSEMLGAYKLQNSDSFVIEASALKPSTVDPDPDSLTYLVVQRNLTNMDSSSDNGVTDARVLYGIMLALPAENLPSSLAEVDRLIVFEYDYKRTDTYTYGVVGYSCIVTGYITDFRTGEVLELLGSSTNQPPEKITVTDTSKPVLANPPAFFPGAATLNHFGLLTDLEKETFANYQ